MTFFSQQTADFMGSRSVKMNWSLDPTIVPEKLRAMREACRWVTYGPQAVSPDVLLLMSYQHHLPPGYYFDVLDRLEALPRGWLHCVNRRLDVPHHACYWAGWGGKFVWVGPEGMASLSELSLILQKIGRADLESAYFPRPRTRRIEKGFRFREGGQTYEATATFYVDQDGWVTAGDGLPSLPRKKRYENYGQYSELRSVINAAAKSGP